METSEMSVAPASETATLRLRYFLGWASGPVKTPVNSVILHCDQAERGATVLVRTSGTVLAVAFPGTAVKWVPPHPEVFVMSEGPLNVNEGRKMDILSLPPVVHSTQN